MRTLDTLISVLSNHLVIVNEVCFDLAKENDYCILHPEAHLIVIISCSCSILIYTILYITCRCQKGSGGRLMDR